MVNKKRNQRFHAVGSKDQRQASERDRDRVLYSSAFHRLAGITQIVRAGEDSIFHTRQQHTIKVAQVGRRLAQRLQKDHKNESKARGLDPEVVEAACLAHDLGHPPFGHIGEETLDVLVRDKGNKDGFEGNAQSFRIITKLAVRFPDCGGMDLTRATLAACLKYPWFRGQTGRKSKKWSAYNSEKDEFDFAREFFNHEKKSLEAEIMDWADDVAYSVHDIEDFFRCNALPWNKIFSEKELLVKHASQDGSDPAQMGAAYDRLKSFLDGSFKTLLSEPYEGDRIQREQMRRMTSMLINQYMGAISVNQNLDDPRAVKFNENKVAEVKILKQITRDYVIGNPSLAAQQRGQKRVVEELFDAITSECDNEAGYPAFLPVRLRYLNDLSGKNTARFAADCIASLTEPEAIGLHSRLVGRTPGSVLDPIVR